MFFKLLILAVLIVILKPIIGLLFRLLLRTVFRRGLEYVGEKALAKQPDQIHLTPRPGHAWLDRDAVDNLVAPLATRHFDEVGTYTIQEMDGIGVRFLIQPEQRVVAG